MYALPIHTRAYITHTPSVCVRGVCTCMYRYCIHTRKLSVCVCITYTYTCIHHTQTHGVCVVYVRVWIGIEHTHVRVCAIPIHTRACSTRIHSCVCMVYVRVWIGIEHTHKVRVCAIPIHTRACSTRTHSCVCMVYVLVYTYMYCNHLRTMSLCMYYFRRMPPKLYSTKPRVRMKVQTIHRHRTTSAIFKSVEANTLEASHLNIRSVWEVCHSFLRHIVNQS